MDIGTIESRCARLECLECCCMHAYCGLSVHAVGILCHSVVCTMYYAHCCLQHPLIYKQIRYCNINNIIKLADFQFKFYIREGGGVIHFYFSMRVGHFFTIFFNGGSLTLLESFASPPLDINTDRSLIEPEAKTRRLNYKHRDSTNDWRGD